MTQRDLPPPGLPAPAIFLDRDGVILENRDDYVKSVAEAVLLPGVVAALAQLANAPYRIVIATNQALVGRGIIPLGEAEAINQWVVAEIRRGGGRVDGAYLCPHHPEAGCACRKPRPGMLLEAAADLNLDLARSVMIGDAITDLQAGRAVGVAVALVRSGRGADQAALLPASGFGQVPVFADLTEAARALVDGLIAPRSSGSTP